MTVKINRRKDVEGSGQSLEKDLERLQKIVEMLEQGEAPLETALTLYEEGIALSKACMDRLQKAELKIKMLSKDSDGKTKLEDFE
jgi:exodeoxyribonuclease VII small subunit